METGRRKEAGCRAHNWSLKQATAEKPYQVLSKPSLTEVSLWSPMDMENTSVVPKSAEVN